MPPSFGSGSTLLGGDAGSALQEAMARRATGQTGATAQQTPASPGFQPMPQSPTGQAPQLPMGGQPGQPMPQDPSQQTAQPNSPFDPAELKMITGALTNRLKLLGGIQQTMAGVPPRGA